MSSFVQVVIFQNELKLLGSLEKSVTLNRPPGSSVAWKLFLKHSQMLADFLLFSASVPFLLQRKVQGR